MSLQEAVNKINAAVSNHIQYTDRAARDMKRAHFTEEMLKEILSNPRKVEECGENTYILHNKKTAKLKVEITQNGSLLVHWFEYNKVAFCY
ncbi:hypothetical protein BFT35_01685 [Thermoanaerobacterium thermosaccharolyticum]|uniref:Seroreactive antigen BMN1-3B n=1 Tax=Thermoanaerobacterium thermosaccharolyticum TaxID=1517 RepID=A0A223I197_THETR|nr:hypothetical protein [Thermoanaerobacterium thermosaccharolyticum]AST58427.1 seroreactive antigen BMN1-3B [Thermoanaerobacterium thermosaccharolyticum]PHO08200.1 hypothetical protein BFT35_01685 [Thermoanaerobacterium thermosaccharolyticum]